MARELDALIERRGRPKSCVSDNGTELTSMAILKWMQVSGVAWQRAWGSDANSVSFRHSSRSRPMKLSAKAFCCGLPGAM